MLRCFHTVFSRNSIKGNGGTRLFAVHHDPGDDNALGGNKDFISDIQFAAFGDSGDINFKDFADTLFLVAHKLTNAITEYTQDRMLDLIQRREGINFQCPLPQLWRSGTSIRPRLMLISSLPRICSLLMSRAQHFVSSEIWGLRSMI